MSYLLDRKIKRKKWSYVAASLVLVLFLFYFRNGIWNSLAFTGGIVFRPVSFVGRGVGGMFGSLGAYFSSKKSLATENENLKSRLSEEENQILTYNTVLADNANLKEVLGRKDPKVDMILSAILAKPNQSPYDTLVIDVGTNQSVKAGDMVYVSGNIPVGIIAETYLNTSKVVLFSNSGEKTQALVGSKNTPMEVLGRGGGNFEMILPRDFTPVKGDTVVLPGITPRVIAIVETVISDPRDPFVKALLISPVNIQEIKFVEVEK